MDKTFLEELHCYFEEGFLVKGDNLSTFEDLFDSRLYGETPEKYQGPVTAFIEKGPLLLFLSINNLTAYKSLFKEILNHHYFDQERLEDQWSEFERLVHLHNPATINHRKEILTRINHLGLTLRKVGNAVEGGFPACLVVEKDLSLNMCKEDHHVNWFVMEVYCNEKKDDTCFVRIDDEEYVGEVANSYGEYVLDGYYYELYNKEGKCISPLLKEEEILIFLRMYQDNITNFYQIADLLEDFYFYETTIDDLGPVLKESDFDKVSDENTPTRDIVTFNFTLGDRLISDLCYTSEGLHNSLKINEFKSLDDGNWREMWRNVSNELIEEANKKGIIIEKNGVAEYPRFWDITSIEGMVADLDNLSVALMEGFGRYIKTDWFTIKYPAENMVIEKVGYLELLSHLVLLTEK